jgi:plasmid stabilization system protein ParE
MPPRVVELHRLAGRELRKARRWYERRSSASARRFQGAVGQVMQQIAAAAELGSPFQQRFRWMQVKRFPYLLYYEIRDPHPVWVYAVAHVRRRPGYWLRRVPP